MKYGLDIEEGQEGVGGPGANVEQAAASQSGSGNSNWGGENEKDEGTSDEDDNIDESEGEECSGSSDETDETDDDDEEDEEEECESDSDEGQVSEDGVSASQSQDLDSSSSSGGEGQTETCPVCLAKIREQDVGSPEGCDHNFCLECIVEWSKNVNTCPVDRQVFHLILARHSLEGVIYKKIPIRDQELQLEEEGFEDRTDCEECGRGDREDRMLLCDSCNLGYHLECLDPPLESVPRGTWYCPGCARTTRRLLHQEPMEEEVEEAPAPRAPYRVQRQVPRTPVRERVLAAISRIREVRSNGRRRIVDSESEFEVDIGFLEECEPSTSGGPSTAARSRPTTKRKKTTRRRKRKSTKRKTTRKSKKPKTITSSTGVAKKTTRKRRKKRKGKKRKTKKSAARTKRTTPTTIKTRIAGKLGMSSPPVGRTLPLVRGRSERSVDLQRSDVGIAPLSILGDRNELLGWSNQSDDEEVAVGGHGGTLIARRAVPRFGPGISKTGVNSHSPDPSAQRFRAALPDVRGGGSAAGDLLGNILSGQSLLLTEPKDVTINKDGSLLYKQLPVADKLMTESKLMRQVGFSLSEPAWGSGRGAGDALRRPAPRTASLEQVDGEDGKRDDAPAGETPSGAGSSGAPDAAAGDATTSDADKSGAGGDGDCALGGGAAVPVAMDAARSGDSGARGDGSPRGTGGREDAEDSDADDVPKKRRRRSDAEGNVNNSNSNSAGGGGDGGGDSDEYGSDRNGGDGSPLEGCPLEGSPLEGSIGSEEAELDAAMDASRGEEMLDHELVVDERDQVLPETSPAPRVVEEEEEEDGDPDEERRGGGGGDGAPERDNDCSSSPTGAVLGDVSPLSDSDGPGDGDGDGDLRPEVDTPGDPPAPTPPNGRLTLQESFGFDATLDETLDDTQDSGDLAIDGPDGDREEEEEGEGSQAGDRRENGDGEEEEEEGDGGEDEDDDDIPPSNVVPISELPRIPKVRQPEESSAGANELALAPEAVVSNTGVLGRLDVAEGAKSYPKWDKGEKREKGREGRAGAGGGSGRGDSQDDADGEESVISSRDRRRHKDRHRDKDRRDEDDASVSSRHKRHKRHSRSRSRGRSKSSRRSRSRSRERRRRSRSRERRSDDSRRRRDRSDRSRERRRRSRSHSPRRHGDRERHRASADEYQGSVKMFSQSLKDAAEAESNKRFRLKRNFYQQYQEKYENDPIFDKPPPDKPPFERPSAASLRNDQRRSPSPEEPQETQITVIVSDRYEGSLSSRAKPAKQPEKICAFKTPGLLPERSDRSDRSDRSERSGKSERHERSSRSHYDPKRNDRNDNAPDAPSEAGDSIAGDSVISLSESEAPSVGRLMDPALGEDKESGHFRSDRSLGGLGSVGDVQSLLDRQTIFKVPEAPPPRIRPRDLTTHPHLNPQLPSIVQLPVSPENSSYDPSEPTEAGSPPMRDLFELRHPADRLSPAPLRSPFHEMVRGPHRGPLLADPPGAGAVDALRPPYVTVSEGGMRLSTVVGPHLPGFNLVHPGHQVAAVAARGVGRPPLLMNPPVLGPHPHSHPHHHPHGHPPMRLLRPGGPHQISWQQINVNQPHNILLHNRIPISVAQNGLLHAHPNGPEAAHFQPPPPPRFEPPPPPPSVPDTLGTPPPPLPPKALEEMQQISQLLNAQAQLAQVALVSKSGDMRAPMHPRTHMTLAGGGSGGSLSASNAVSMALAHGTFSLDGLFKAPPPPLPPPKLNDRVTMAPSYDETMEVVDMDVASPLSDEDIKFSFSPPPTHGGRDLPGKDKRVKHVEDLKEDDLTSAEDLHKQEKFMKKLNRQERVVEEVKQAIKPHYSRGKIDKEEYKEIMRKCVPKICHSKSGDINPEKIRNYVEAYVEKMRQTRKYESKKAGGPGQNKGQAGAGSRPGATGNQPGSASRGHRGQRAGGGQRPASARQK